MKQYTIYCTPEQTKMAFDLGAPLETCDWRITDTSRYIELDNEKGWHIQIPTAEQMIGWLEEQENIIEICIKRISNWRFEIFIEPYIHKENSGYLTREEATLAAIDAALEYLENLKQ